MDPQEIKNHLVKDIGKLEQLASRYAQGGLTLYELAKLSVYSAYTLVRAAESLEHATLAEKKVVITDSINAILDHYKIDTPLPDFFDQMLRGLLVETVVKAAVDVLSNYHYKPPT